MNINPAQSLQDTPMTELLDYFLGSHASSNGMDFVSDNQLRNALNIIMSELDDRGLDLVDINE